jgi:transcription elongation factor GreA
MGFRDPGAQINPIGNRDPMTEMTTSAGLTERILEAARRGEIAEAESLWLEIVESPPDDSAFYIQFAQSSVRHGAGATGLEMLLLVLEQARGGENWTLVERIVNAAAGHWPDSEPLRRHAIEGLRGRYGSRACVDEMISASKIAEGAPLDRAIKRFRDFLRLSPGQVYQHKSWGEGVVRTLDVAGGRIILDFPGEPAKAVTFEGVRKFLTRLAPTHFLARRAKEPDKLREMGEANPAALVKLALEGAGGRMKQSELKSLLAGAVIAEKSWTSWWTRARRDLKFDPLVEIDVSGGSRAEIALRAKPRTMEEDVEVLFFGPDADLVSRAAGLKSLAQAGGAAADRADLMRRLLARLSEESRLRDWTLAQRLTAALLVEEARAIAPESGDAATGLPRLDDLLGKLTDYAPLAEVQPVDYAIRAFQVACARDGESALARAAELLPRAPSRLIQAVWKRLNNDEGREAAAAAFQQLLDDPMANPSGHLWAVKSILDGSLEHMEAYFPKAATVMAAISDLESIHAIAEDPKESKETREAAKQLLPKVRSLLTGDNHAALCEAAAAMSFDQAQRLKASIQSNRALGDSFKSSIARALRLTRRDLDETPAKPAVDDTVNYCTARAKEEATRKLQRMTSVEIPANSKAIEEARREGDLKENAGYHAAKDEQKMLMQKVMALQEALAAAKIVEADEVPSDRIAFGTRFEAQKVESGEVETLTVLGRWEADPERCILSIQAPLAQQFLGRSVGEAFEVEHPGGGTTAYRVLKIENALAAGEWAEMKEEG